MIPVPQALRTVLQQAATTIVEASREQQSSGTSRSTAVESISLSSPPHLIGRISSEAIYAPEQGYPPYHASIMDGYAINTNDLQLDLVNDNSTIKRFQIVNRVHAGSSTSTSSAASPTSSSSPSKLKHAMNILMNDNLPKAIYVTTGAVIPYPSYNTVIPLEQVNEYISNQVIAIDLNVLQSAKPNMWIRNVGCDIPSKTRILNRGDVIDSVHVGLLLQCGVTEVKVQPKPTVGILSTGNEIMGIQDMKENDYYDHNHNHHHHPSTTSTNSHNSLSSFPLGMIPDANGPVLSALLTSYQSCNIINYGIVGDDDLEILTNTISEAIQNCNVLITSGGVSMGEKDVIEHVLYDRLGCRIHFGRLNMKPGKPTTFATFDKKNQSATDGSGGGGGEKCLIFAMPGNPVSAYVCTELLVRPCLDMLHSTIVTSSDRENDNILTMVQNAAVHGEIDATLKHRVKLDVERPEYLRVKLSKKVVYDNNENVNSRAYVEFEATSTGVQRSSRLMSMCDADGLMMMPQGRRGEKVFAEAGESYPVLLLKRPGGNTMSKSFLNTINLKDSLHFKNSPLTVGILEVVGEAAAYIDGNTTSNQSNHGDSNIGDDVKNRIENIFDDDSISFLQSVQISHHDSITNIFRTTMSNCLDIILVVCTNTSFQTNLQISGELRGFITKNSRILSSTVVKSAAYEDPLSALFDPVAGYCDADGKSCMLLSLSSRGMQSALESVKGLLMKGVSVAGGKRMQGN